MASIILPAVASESRAGRFGVYGGRYVPETLMKALHCGRNRSNARLSPVSFFRP
jgi:tryptophan synthase beta subunit